MTKDILNKKVFAISIPVTTSPVIQFSQDKSKKLAIAS